MFLLNDQERYISQKASELAKNLLSNEATQQEYKKGIRDNLFKNFSANKLHAITINEKDGGLNLGALAYTLFMEKVAYYCPSSALSLLAHSLLCAHTLAKFGNSNLKKKYLPKLISGEMIGALALTEPNHGSDAFGIETTYIDETLEGDKIWITNGPYADLYLLFAKTSQSSKEISLVAVENNENISRSTPLEKMGMELSPTAKIKFNPHQIDNSQIVGTPNRALKQMVESLEIERIAICGISLGIAKRVRDISIKYAATRHQFGKSIGHFQLIQQKIAWLEAQTAMIEDHLYLSAKRYDIKETRNSLAAIAKFNIPSMVTNLCLEAIQLHGAVGYSKKLPLERFLRDNKLIEIGAGTNEIMISIIAKNALKKA